MMNPGKFMRRLALAGNTAKIAVGCTVLAIALAAGAALESAFAPARSMAAWMPSGAQLYIESPDFAGLLHDWNTSREGVLAQERQLRCLFALAALRPARQRAE